MANKKLLTYEGLEEYNIKWHERLQSLVIDANDVEETFDIEMMRGYTWTYEFDTKLTGHPYLNGVYSNGTVDYGAWWQTSYVTYEFNKAAIPFWFPNGVSVTVDWGDGTVETISGEESIENFAGADANSKVFHTYADSLSIYKISVSSNQWDKIWLCGGDAGNCIYYIGSYGTHWYVHSDQFANSVYKDGEYIYTNCSCVGEADSGCYGFDSEQLCGGVIGQIAAMRMGCTKIFNPLPHLAGVIQCNSAVIDPSVSAYSGGRYNGKTPEEYFADIPEANTLLQNSMYFALAHYQILEYAPSNLFEYNLSCTDFTGCTYNNPLESSIEYPVEKAQSFTIINHGKVI